MIGKKKYLDSPETQNTNSVLNQNSSDDQQFSENVHVEPNYDFSRRGNKSFKAEATTLLNINFKRRILKLMNSIIEDNQNKKIQNS